VLGTSDVAMEVDRVLQSFNACERPLLFAGNGIRLARAEKEFEALRERVVHEAGYRKAHEN